MNEITLNFGKLITKEEGGTVGQQHSWNQNKFSVLLHQSSYRDFPLYKITPLRQHFY